MQSLPDADLLWTERFVKYGFAVRRGLVSKAFCSEAIARVREIIGNDLPLEQWRPENTSGVRHDPYRDAYQDAWLTEIDPGVTGVGLAHHQASGRREPHPASGDAAPTRSTMRRAGA